MSRGGGARGGRGGGGGRGGRGGGGFSGGGGFGGGFDDLVPDYSVTELFPPQPPPVQSSLIKEERAIIARFRSHREKIHNGPMYTIMSKKRGMEDPFNDVSKYSQKYKKQRRKVPQLDARPYIHELFPLELHLTLGIDPDEVNGKKKAIKKKLQFSALDTLDPLGDLADGAGSDIEEGAEGADVEGAEKKKGGLLRGLLGEEAGYDEDEEQEPEEEEIEDDFGDDEEGDYNAEQYFDDGDDIGDDWGDEGGAEDYY